MYKSIILPDIVKLLTERARALGLNDSEWASRAGVRSETLSRLRSRLSCDFSTLNALAVAVGTAIGVLPGSAVTTDNRYPAHFDRRYEECLLDLCAGGSFDVQCWRAIGPAFFMAGLSVMLASVPGYDRRSMLELGELLHTGSSQVGVFAIWLEGSPLSPARFLSMLAQRISRAA